MNESSSNPFASSATSPISDVNPARPIGTVLLALFLLVTGILVGGQRYLILFSALSSGEQVTIHPSFYCVLARDTVTALTAVASGVGLLMGARFGWWLAFFHLIWRLITQTVLPLISSAARVEQLEKTVPNPSLAVFGVTLFLLAVYLQKDNVTAYYRVAPKRMIACFAIVIAAIVLGVTFDLAAMSLP